MSQIPATTSHANRSERIASASAQAPWSPDCGDGRYRNPVLNADYSDPDAIRVGEDYWMTASSFSHAPGLPLLHSRDLVNWDLVGHALPRLVPQDHFSRPHHGCGVWAPSFRFHDGWFWIFYPDPDFGLYMIRTRDPRTAWSEPVLLKGGKGLIDCCPLWDEDGQAYLIHGWAKSRSGICNLLTLHRMSPDGTRLLDAGRTIIDANQMPGWKTLEGPKLYKRNGFYYVFAPAGGVAEGYQAVFRSRDIWGPYEPSVVLEQGASPINGPHQGAWVDTPAGEHWFLHFQEIPAMGRVVHLQPMDWLPNDWVAMGEKRDAQGKGQPVLVHRKPGLPSQPVQIPATSERFQAGHRFGPQWQWQCNPATDWVLPAGSASTGASGLSLRCVPLDPKANLWAAGNLLMQKFPAPDFKADLLVEAVSLEGGDRAGLIVFGYDYAALTLTQRGAESFLILSACKEAQNGNPEKELACVALRGVDGLHLRLHFTEGGRLQFMYRAKDSVGFTPIGPELKATSSKWVGGKVGLFASSSHPDSKGFASFGEFVLTR